MDWCWSSNTLDTWCEVLTHWKRLWSWERLSVGGEGEDRAWGGWMTLLIQWIWVWAISGRWWRTGKPGMLQLVGSRRVGHTEQLNNNNHQCYFPNLQIGLKIYWAWPCPSEQDPVPHHSQCHQEASISTLSYSIRGQTVWKSQKTNQSEHVDHSLVRLNETMSHAM